MKISELIQRLEKLKKEAKGEDLEIALIDDNKAEGFFAIDFHPVFDIVLLPSTTAEGDEMEVQVVGISGHDCIPDDEEDPQTPEGKRKQLKVVH
jgi:hypothetical protein